MRSILSFFSMLALGLMIAAVIVVSPSGKGTTNVGGFELTTDPTLDYRSVVAGLGIGLAIALIAHISWADTARRVGSWLGGQARRAFLISLAIVFAAVLYYF
jgi:hypothetical protein